MISDKNMAKEFFMKCVRRTGPKGYQEKPITVTFEVEISGIDNYFHENAEQENVEIIKKQLDELAALPGIEVSNFKHYKTGGESCVNLPQLSDDKLTSKDMRLVTRILPGHVKCTIEMTGDYMHTNMKEIHDIMWTIRTNHNMVRLGHEPMEISWVKSHEKSFAKYDEVVAIIESPRKIHQVNIYMGLYHFKSFKNINSIGTSFTCFDFTIAPCQSYVISLDRIEKIETHADILHIHLNSTPEFLDFTCETCPNNNSPKFNQEYCVECPLNNKDGE